MIRDCHDMCQPPVWLCLFGLVYLFVLLLLMKNQKNEEYVSQHMWVGYYHNMLKGLQ